MECNGRAFSCWVSRAGGAGRSDLARENAQNYSPGGPVFLTNKQKICLKKILPAFSSSSIRRAAPRHAQFLEKVTGN
jgi:hypothetical protein